MNMNAYAHAYRVCWESEGAPNARRTASSSPPAAAPLHGPSRLSKTDSAMRRAAGYRRTESIDGEEERERDRERRFHHSETPPPPPSRRRARSGATAYADDEVVTLNVGGTTFSTLFSTLVSVEGSRLGESSVGTVPLVARPLSTRMRSRGWQPSSTSAFAAVLSTPRYLHCCSAPRVRFEWRMLVKRATFLPTLGLVPCTASSHQLCVGACRGAVARGNRAADIALSSDTPRDASGAWFIDRDPRPFADVLNFLRDRSYPMPVHDAAALARLRAEARYFGLDALAKVIDSATDKCGEVSHGLSDTRASPALSPTRSISGAGAVVANAMGFASPPRVGSGTGGGHTAIDSTTGHKLQSEFIRSVSGSLGDLCERCVSVVVEALTLQAGSGKMEVLLWLRTFEAGSLQGLSSEGVIRGYDLRHNDLKLHEDFAPLLSGSGLALLTHQLRSCGLSFVPTKEVRMVATHSSSGSGSDKYAELPMLRFTLDPAEGIKGSFRSTQAAVLAAAAGVDNLSIVLRSVLSSEEISGVPARSVFTTTRHGR